MKIKLPAGFIVVGDMREPGPPIGWVGVVDYGIFGDMNWAARLS